MFDCTVVEDALRAKGWDLPFVLCDELDSTNHEAKRLVLDGKLPNGGLVLTDRQSAGKGRLGRTWYAVEGKDLTFTLAFKNDLNRIDIPKTGLTAALGICHALEKDFGIAARLRWPNDILVEGEKVAGILSEYIAPQEFILIGVGINVNSGKDDWKFTAVTRPTSLTAASGAPIDREALLASCATSVRDFLSFARWEYFPTFQALYETRAFYGNKRVAIYQDAFNDEAEETPAGSGVQNVIEGIALGIDRYGALLVRDDMGRDHSVRAGDVVLPTG